MSQPLHDWITIDEEDLMLLIHCALFRDSWTSDGINPLVMSQLTPENQAKVRKWESAAP